MRPRRRGGADAQFKPRYRMRSPRQRMSTSLTAPRTTRVLRRASRRYDLPLSFSGGVLGGVFELALDDDLSESDELDDAPADGVGLD